MPLQQSIHWKANAAFIIAAILPVLAYVNVPLFRDNYRIAEPIIFCCICVLALISLVKFKTLTVSRFEIAGLLFILFCAVKDIALGVFDISSLAQALLLVLIYVTLKCYDAPGVLGSAAVIVLCAGIFIYNPGINNVLTPNKSILSILLACHMAFIIPVLLTMHRSQPVFWAMVLALALGAILLYLTAGRAGWIGLLAALAFIFYHHKLRQKSRLLLTLTVAVLLIISTALAFLYKSDSSQGRMLIYKVSAGMLAQDWLLGIGKGQFKVRYNEHQSQYFAQHSIDSKEAMLADNTFYAFNDFFEILIEGGIVGFALYAMAVLLLIRAVKISKPMHVAAVASLICIATAALFSYPLQSFPIAAQAAICLALLPVGGTFVRYRAIPLIVCLLLAAHFCYLTWYRAESHSAFTLSRAGFKKDALEKYARLGKSYINEGNTNLSYAQQLYYANRPGEAATVLHKAKRRLCSHEAYMLSAKIAEGINDYKTAQRHYLFAVNMVPNRMLSRFELLNFYLRRNDTAQARHWANSIMHMPVKVPSATTNNLQKKTAGILSTLQ